MKTSIIFVSRFAEVNTNELVNAYYLCNSVANQIYLIWNLQKQIPNEIASLINSSSLRLVTRASENAESDYSFLDEIPLESEILVVTAGSTEELYAYFHRRMRLESSTETRWNVLSSNYARFSLLERQRTLSDFIPVDTTLWLADLISKFSRSDILDSLNHVSDNSTLLVGESIIDEYVFCDALGKVSKDPLVAFLKKEFVRHLGGVLATAKHFAGLGSKVHIVSEIGKTDQLFVQRDLESFSRLTCSFETHFHSILKTRYVDRASNNRIFETYTLPENYSNGIFKQALRNQLPELTEIASNLVIMDYGHQMFDSEIIEMLLKSNLKISINAQSNAGNRGFNTIAKYRGADKVFLNGSEVLLEMRERDGDLTSLVPILGSELDFGELYVTNGSRGILCYSRAERLFLAPAFAPSIVDRTGAGDATLAVISALRANEVPREIAAFFGNIAGALLVSTIGNEITITRELLLKEASGILEKIERQ